MFFLFSFVLKRLFWSGLTVSIRSKNPLWSGLTVSVLSKNPLWPGLTASILSKNLSNQRTPSAHKRVYRLKTVFPESKYPLPVQKRRRPYACR